MTAVMELRVAAAQATVDRFKDQPWKPGKFDCWQMIRSHCIAMKQPLKVAAKIGTYHTVPTGIRRLRKLGFRNIPAVLDEVFERIAPAAAIAGDLIQLASEDDDIGGLTVCVGNGRVIGFHEHAPGACVMQPFEMIAAWRLA